MWDLRRWQFSYPSLAPVDPYQLTLKELVSEDRWQNTITLPRWDRTRRQDLFPVSVIDPLQLTQAERTTPDKWWTRAEEPRRDVARQQHLSPASWLSPFPITTGEVITLDKWFQPTETRLRDVPRMAFVSPSSIVDPFQLTQPERLTPDKWLGSKPDILFRQAPFRFFHHFEMPERELLVVTDDLPWDFRDFYRPRSPIPLRPESVTDGRWVAPVAPVVMSWYLPDQPRLTMSPSPRPDQLMDPKWVAPPPPVLIPMSWYLQDMIVATLRRPVSVEPRSQQYFVSPLLGILGRIVAVRTGLLQDLVTRAVAISDDLIRSGQF